VKPSLELSGGGADPFEADGVQKWADVVFGLRVNYDLTERWYVQTFGDVGGGASKVQWQAYAGAGYSFVDWFGLQAGFRIVGVNYNRDDFKFKVNTQGFNFGLNFRI
jgi:hypothetical protein